MREDDLKRFQAITSPEFRAACVSAAEHLEALARCARNTSLLIESDAMANSDAIVAQLTRAIRAFDALKALGVEHRELLQALKPAD